MMSQWAGTPISNIFQFVVIYIVESFRVVNEAEIDVFMGLPCFLHDPTNARNLIYICICLYIYILNDINYIVYVNASFFFSLT